MKASLAWLVIFCSVFAVAQDHSAIQPNTVYAGADGKFEANPDTAVVQCNISAQEATSQAAYAQASKDTDQVRQILRQNGIDPASAHFASYSIQPVYDYRNPKRKLVGFRVAVSVSLKLKDFSKVAPIIQQLADAGITENQSVSYTLEDMEPAKVQAVQDAFRTARANARAVADAGGRSLGQLSYASVDVNENPRVFSPMPRVMAMSAETAATTPAPNEQFTPQTIEVTAHVNALFELK